MYWILYYYFIFSKRHTMYIELQFARIEPHYSKFAIILLEYFQLRKVRANFVGEKT